MKLIQKFENRAAHGHAIHSALQSPRTAGSHQPSVRRQLTIAVFAAILLGAIQSSGYAVGPEPNCVVPEGRFHALTIGALVDTEIRGGQCHHYSIRSSTAPISVRVEQNGVDIVLIIFSQNTAVQIDTPIGDQWSETALIKPDEGVSAFEIRAKGSEKIRGHYIVRIDVLRGDVPLYSRKLAAHEAAQKATGQDFAIARTNETLPQLAELFDRAARSWAHAGDTEQTALMYLCKAWIERDMGDYPDAVSTFHRAEEWLRTAGKHRLRLRVVLHRALTEIGIPAYASAEKALIEAIDSSDSSTEPALYAHLHIALGLSYHNQGRFDEARGLYRQALTILSGGVDANLEAMATNNLAGIDYELGNFGSALELFEKALFIHEKAGNEVERTHALMNRAYLYANAGEFDSALIDFQHSLETFEKLDLKSDVALALHGIGLSYLGLGAYSEAKRFFENSLTLGNRDSGNAVQSISTQLLLGDVYRHRGDMTKAIELHTQALQASRKISNPFYAASADAALGADHIAAKQAGAALPLLHKARDQFAKLGYRRELADALQTLATAQAEVDGPTVAMRTLKEALSLHFKSRNQRGAVSALAALSRLQTDGGDLAEGLRSASRAAEILESTRDSISQADLRAGYFGSVADPFARLVQIHMLKHREEPDVKHDVAAFLAAERSRARSLRDVLDRVGVDPHASASPKLREKRARLKLELNGKHFRLRSLHERIDSLTFSNNSISRLEGLRTEIALVESLLTRILAQLDATEAEIKATAATVTPSMPISEADLHSIQKMLDADTILLSYFVSEPHSYLWTVTDSGLDTYLLPGEQTLETLAREAYRKVTTVDHSGVDEGDGELRRLAKAILPALASLLAHRRAIIVPDGILGYIPFAALPIDSGTGATAELLIDHQTISYLPAASLFTRLSARTMHSVIEVIVFANPLLSVKGDSGAIPLTSAVRGEEAAVRPPIRLSDYGPLTDLPYSSLEAEQISALLPSGTVYVAIGPDANKQAVVQEDLTGYRVLHFATHGIVNSEFPELSGLMLSQFDDTGRPIDGFLTLSEIYDLRLNADLVVLSACRTALGESIRGEGFLSLSRGFLVAGARGTISSLWDVSDLATAELMRATYEAMYRKKLTPAEALRAAQLHVRKITKWDSPYFWAGFSAVGATEFYGAIPQAGKGFADDVAGPDR